MWFHASYHGRLSTPQYNLNYIVPINVLTGERKKKNNYNVTSTLSESVLYVICFRQSTCKYIHYMQNVVINITMQYLIE